MTAVLYILMRNDLNSLNSGKAMAQASHASNAFVSHFHAYMQNINCVGSASRIKDAENLNKSFLISIKRNF